MSNSKLSSEKEFLIEMYTLFSVVFSAGKKRVVCVNVCLGAGETFPALFHFQVQRKIINLRYTCMLFA